jgi:hypothetical protein
MQQPPRSCILTPSKKINDLPSQDEEDMRTHQREV